MDNDKTDHKKKADGQRGRFLNAWWKQFLTSILGTTISIALTFGTSTWVSSHKKEQARRQTAMMLIYDIDDGIRFLKQLKGWLETDYNAAVYALDYADQIDAVPWDTLGHALTLITTPSSEWKVDLSTETLFNSSQDSWSNLDNMVFIKSVQTYYLELHDLLDEINHSAQWAAPVSLQEVYDIMDEGGYGADEIVKHNLRAFAARQLKDKKVRGYIHRTVERIDWLRTYIERWSNQNAENKFLMNITDEDLEEYKKHMSKEGYPLTERDLVGQWQSATSTDDRTAEIEFRADHTFTETQTLRYAMIGQRGKAALVLTVGGRWLVDGDSLVRQYATKTFDMRVDTSQMAYRPEMADSVRAWIESNFGEGRRAYWQEAAFEEERSVRTGSFDISRNRLELTQTSPGPDGQEQTQRFHFSRKKD